MTTSILQIQKSLEKFFKKEINKDNFIYDILLAYGKNKTTIKLLQKGNYNQAKVEGEVISKGEIHYIPTNVSDEQVYDLVIEKFKSKKKPERFIIATNFSALVAYDTKTNDILDIEFKEFTKNFDFFLPLAGMEKTEHKSENPADVKAAEKMAKLFDQIRRDNPDNSEEAIHNLNVFMSRLLFCFFAEDTNIFEDNLFTKSIDSHTQKDGSDLNYYLDNLFTRALNTPKDKRGSIAVYMDKFPYVGGSLFSENIKSPIFTTRSRRAIIQSGELDWSEINPDIFGSMIQAVVTPEHRGGLGMHYTSVPNIMKVIEPLFLNELKETFEKAKGNNKKLQELLNRIRKIKIFDPACGSGNFLIIAYKELRKLEMSILTEMGGLPMSGISLSNFYGIELDDFAHEVATLSLWLAKHQMNVAFYKEFGQRAPSLPLTEAGKIVHGNACRLDWEKVCPKKEDDEIYILGNPPYLGSSNQNKDQKSDQNFCLSLLPKFKKLDYISNWFYKASNFISKFSSIKASFVSTNSIVEGEQVGILWPYILKNCEISFAYKSFKWINNAKNNAGVSVVIIGIAKRGTTLNKVIFSEDNYSYVDNINPYLINTKDIIINNRNNNLSKLQPSGYGSKAVDGGHLIMSNEEKETVVKENPGIIKYIKQFIGSDEFINNYKRWCFWIESYEVIDALKYKEINERVNSVKEFRLKSTKQKTKDLAEYGYQFGEIRFNNKDSLIIPSVSSEKRKYIPIGFLGSNYVISNSAHLISDCKVWLFSILTSLIHNVWTKTVCGSLDSRIRYSTQLSYNNFPIHQLNKKKIEELEDCAFKILEEREKHPDKTLAQLYDPDKMPEGLKEAHRLNDETVERCYRSKPFESDEERLEHLFKLYEKMIAEEKKA